MKKYIAALVVLLIIFSCEEYPGPGSLTIESFRYQLIGNGQGAPAGEYLEMEIGAYAQYNSDVYSSDLKFRTEFTVVSGGGSVDKSSVEADLQNKMVTRWKLGADQNEQIVKGKIFDASGKMYSEFTINATAYINNQLNIINSGYLTQIKDMVYDTVNHRSLMISSSTIYSLKGSFFEWDPVFSDNGIYFKDLEINSKNEVFGGSWDGKLYKSTDWGKSWIYVANPINGYNYNFELTISDDDFIWANQWEKGMYCSQDNGLTWHHDTLGFVTKELTTRVYSYTENSHLTLSLPKATVFQSTDNGFTWKALNTPVYANEMFVTDKNELIVCNQEYGLSLHKSINNGLTYRKVLSADIAYRMAPMSSVFGKFGGNYYFLAPGGGIYKTLDFEKFEELVSFDLPRYLYIDHTGTLYAGGYPGEPVYVLPDSK
jgi:hypothetical protein